MKLPFNLQSVIARLRGYLQRLRHYTVVIFLALVISLYAFVLLRINAVGNQQPSADAVSSQVKAARIPHIDKAVVRQLQTLQDNSVSVQALFNEARSNPFQE